MQQHSKEALKIYIIIWADIQYHDALQEVFKRVAHRQFISVE